MEEWQSVLLGGCLALLGGLLSTFVNTWLEGQKVKRERLQKIHSRLVGEHIQSSEVTSFIDSKKTLFFWKQHRFDLSKTNLVRADLRKKNLRKANFFDANLEKADLDHADLRQADLTNANLSWANLRGARLNKANLYKAKLNGAYLRSANLSEAKMDGADVSEADLCYANLCGVNLSSTTMSENVLLYIGVEYNNETKWPDGFNKGVLETLPKI